MQSEGRQIWLFDMSMSASAVSLDKDSNSINLPEKLALVMGTEDGCSLEMSEAANKLVCLSTFGFTESLNLSIAAALVINKLFYICPEARGDLDEAEKKNLRKKWYGHLAANGRQAKLYELFICNPPELMDDLRKPDDHRVAFVPQTITKRIREKEGLCEGEDNERNPKNFKTEQK